MEFDHRVAAVVLPAAFVLFSIAAAVAIARIVRGPAILDRMIATDVLLSTMLCSFAVFMAVTGRTDLQFILLAMAFFGFVGSVAVSRYVARSENTAQLAPPADSDQPSRSQDASDQGASAESTADPSPTEEGRP
ncbi:monovalent cation/H+ antiporter complex subunit F [Brevibacterium sp. HMSC07C04]|uniref:monovalent cation/H+ antiporter complex subunit F n=1 Tax=Brevibacterium sp. HMSC07C04 TaxID=1581130 RepID=UPI0008A48BA0|nr:monovalent cation/H+ antiporter complex subunit F [Brevibacterium sp. HMSC07C04]OFS26681.1 hypothetical protein HMPREF3162_04990 [Brevibacterium sp. HMSC07C04]